MAAIAALLARFPPVPDTLRERFRFVSGSMRLVSARSALHVSIGERGLHLATSWLFRPLTHPGIPCIPWSELRCVRAQPERGGWFGSSSRFEIPRVGLRFELAGKPGRAVEAALQRHAAGAPARL